MRDAFVVPPKNPDLAEVVELAIHQDAIGQAGVRAVVAIQGLAVTPPEDPGPLYAYTTALLGAAEEFEALSCAALRAANHLRKRAIACIDADEQRRSQ